MGCQIGTGWMDGWRAIVGCLKGQLEAERKTADGQDYTGLKYSHDSLRESRPEKLHLLEIPIQERERERERDCASVNTLSLYEMRLGQFSIRRQTAGILNKHTHDMRDYTCSEDGTQTEK